MVCVRGAGANLNIPARRCYAFEAFGKKTNKQQVITLDKLNVRVFYQGREGEREKKSESKVAKGERERAQIDPIQTRVILLAITWVLHLQTNYPVLCLLVLHPLDVLAWPLLLD